MPGGCTWIPEVFSYMRRLSSNHKDLTEPETTLEKSLNAAIKSNGYKNCTQGDLPQICICIKS